MHILARGIVTEAAAENKNDQGANIATLTAMESAKELKKQIFPTKESGQFPSVGYRVQRVGMGMCRA